MEYRGYHGYLRGTRVLSQHPRGDAAGQATPRESYRRSEAAVVTRAAWELTEPASRLILDENAGQEVFHRRENYEHNVEHVGFVVGLGTGTAVHPIAR